MSDSGQDRLETLAARNFGNSWRLSALGVSVLLVVLLAWASVSSLDEVVIAEGKIVPQEQVRVV